MTSPGVSKRIRILPSIWLARLPYFIDPAAREGACAFLLKYQDRVLYATDLVVFPRSKTEDTLAEFRHTYARDWKFLATDEKLEYFGHTYQGLALPRPVLQKLFHDNSARWFPGLVNSGVPARPQSGE